jgi:hypothetical protein
MPEHSFEPGSAVWARKGHGLINRVPRRTHGTVLNVRPDGKVTVEWDNSKTSTVRPARLGVGADVDPHFAALIEHALSEVNLGPGADDSAHVTAWNNGWHSALGAVRESLIAEGLIPDPDLFESSNHLPEESPDA